MTAKKWNYVVLGVTASILVIIALAQIIIDPFLHYHDGLNGLEYPLKDERFINDGLQRNRDYEIMITGTSMSQNFNASRFCELWGMDTIKTAYSGATFHELGENMQHAINHNSNLKMIVCSLDAYKIAEDADADFYEGIPYYLYDDNPFNEVNYLFNKDVITKSIAVVNYTRSGQKTPDMDLYGRYDVYMPSGRDAVMASFNRMDEQDLSIPFTENDKEKIRLNVVGNFVELARKNPKIQFVFYLPPYSYCYWDALIRTNQMDYNIEALRYAVGLMTGEENISIYAFYEWDEVTTNLDYYSDTLHYNGLVCDKITEAIFNNECQLTRDNYEEYFDNMEKMYYQIDYSDLD